MALDCNIPEWDFWDMTIGELERAIESKRRIKRRQDQEKASFDYVLADLIGKSISRLYSSSNKMPELSEAYPTLFDSKEMQEKKQEKKDELSALRFKQFAEAFNNKKSNGEVDKK